MRVKSWPRLARLGWVCGWRGGSASVDLFGRRLVVVLWGQDRTARPCRCGWLDGSLAPRG